MKHLDAIKRHDSRAGYELLTFREVGLPILGIYAAALVQVPKNQSCIAEFILRILDARVESISRIEQLLGIPKIVLDQVFADLVRDECIRTSDAGKCAQLTNRGREKLTAAAESSPQEQTLWIPYDALLRQPKWYGSTLVHRPFELRSRGAIPLHPYPARRPEVGDLSPSAVSEVVRLIAAASPEERDVLRVMRILRVTQQYVLATALVFRAIETSEIEIAFLIDGRISSEHEFAFARSNSIDKEDIVDSARINRDDAEVHGELGEPVANLVIQSIELRDAMATITQSRSEATRAAVTAVTAATPDERAQAEAQRQRATAVATSAEDALRGGPVRPVRPYEHPAILEHALDTATSRVLIACPTVRRAVLDGDMLRRISKACGKGVAVSIAISNDINSSREDNEARKELELLRKQLRTFSFSTGTKLSSRFLLVDNTQLVVTRFPWLSFVGDSARPFENEWGNLIQDEQVVCNCWQRFRQFHVG
jgi:hypothetical protein